MRLSLAWKLLLGYMLVVAVSISTFALLANRSTERELRLMMGQAPEGTALAAERLAAYYRGRGSWEGVESLYPAIPHAGGMGRGMQAAMGVPAVVDSRGLPLLGGLAGPQDVVGATPILVDGTVVGYIFPPRRPELRWPNANWSPGSTARFCWRRCCPSARRWWERRC